jgi:ribonuclease HI
MARRKKKTVRTLYPSPGALPARLAGQYPEHLLVFSDASLQYQGGIAAVLFAHADATPHIASRTTASIGSNELELEASLFAMQQASQHFPQQTFALFSDNQDAIQRLQRAKEHGFIDDPQLASMFAAAGLSLALEHAAFRWIKGHATCRGNILADQHARAAAGHPATTKPIMDGDNTA